VNPLRISVTSPTSHGAEPRGKGRACRESVAQVGPYRSTEDEPEAYTHGIEDLCDDQPVVMGGSPPRDVGT